LSRIVLATTGSIGDLRPYLAVGAGLRSRGHSIAVATASAYRQEVEENGLEFCPVRPFVAPRKYTPEVFRRANDLKTGSTYLVRKMVLPKVDEMYADLLEACHGADLLLIHPILFAAPAAAEKLNIKWISVLLTPGSCTSAYDPPVMPPLSWLHGLRHLGPLPNRLIFELLRRITRSWMKPIDDLRAREGLAPARDNPILMFSPHGTLALFSRVLGQPQPDWPPHTVLTGFPFYENGESALDPALREFLNQGEPPVVFTLGSSAVLHPGEFYEESLQAVRRMGCRAVFLTGPDPATRPAELPNSVFAADYVEFSSLFPHAVAVVHQGGIGTTAEVMRAGAPSLVVPFMHDQPDNAFRAKRLGIARVAARSEYNAKVAERNLSLLLSRPEYAARAKEVAAQIACEHGLNTACTAVERYACSR
jgi:UDP:flavonoid glycosyltransferase YjiC (YdhE family)